ncbi:MAG TPA: SRPBCC domain-containing protein [Thermomicrobiales bacterium]
MTDDANWLTGTEREVGRCRIAAGEARSAIIRRRYDATLEDVWDACTDPARLGRWLSAPSGDFRVGGHYSLAGSARGEILRCEPPRLLRVTWAYWDRPADEVELRLFDGEDGHTILEIEHASIFDVILNDPVQGLWGVGPGWEMPLDYLGAFLRGVFPAGSVAAGREESATDRERASRRGDEWAAVVAADAARNT